MKIIVLLKNRFTDSLGRKVDKKVPTNVFYDKKNPVSPDEEGLTK
jgi:hypothetical protein